MNVLSGGAILDIRNLVSVGQVRDKAEGDWYIVRTMLRFLLTITVTTASSVIGNEKAKLKVFNDTGKAYHVLIRCQCRTDAIDIHQIAVALWTNFYNIHCNNN